MPFNIGGLAEQTAGGIIGAGMGLMLEKHNDARQINQQRELTDIQTAAQERMTDYSYKKQLEMWKNTSYAAQMEQMNKAGINPALLYGMSGGGAQTTGTAGATGTTGGQAPHGGHEIIDIQGQMMAREQIQLLQAQKENIQADTANKQADIPVKQAQAPNIQANTQLTKTQTDIAEIDRQIKSDTQKDVTDQITAIARTADEELQIKINENLITTEQAINTRQTATQQLIALQLENEVKRKHIELTDSQINEISNSIAQKWAALKLEGQRINIEQFKTEIGANYPGLWQVIGKVVNDDLNTVVKKITGNRTDSRRTEQMHK